MSFPVGVFRFPPYGNGIYITIKYVQKFLSQEIMFSNTSRTLFDNHNNKKTMKTKVVLTYSHDNRNYVLDKNFIFCDKQEFYNPVKVFRTQK